MIFAYKKAYKKMWLDVDHKNKIQNTGTSYIMLVSLSIQCPQVNSYPRHVELGLRLLPTTT